MLPKAGHLIQSVNLGSPTLIAKKTGYIMLASLLLTGRRHVLGRNSNQILDNGQKSASMFVNEETKFVLKRSLNHYGSLNATISYETQERFTATRCVLPAA